MAQRVVVFGAAGDQGRVQVEALAAAGHTPVAAGREQPAGDARSYRYADYDQPATVAAACHGADAVFVSFPSSSFSDATRLLAQWERFLAAVGEVAPARLVFNASLPVFDHRTGFVAHDTRLEMLRRLRLSGLPYTAFKPAVFMDNLLRWGRRALVEEGCLRYPHYPTTRVSWICLDDLARLMVASLERPELAGREFRIGGPEALRGPEAAAALSDALGETLGRPIRFEAQPIDAFARELAERFAPERGTPVDAVAAELAGIYRWYNEGPERPFEVPMAAVLRELPVTLTPLASWAARQRWTA